MNKPPFTISTRSINLIAEISAQIERYAIRMEQEDGLMLRKINRIKTIQGSLAIEGNTLSVALITDIIEGRNVMASLREIKEVKNAIKTYNAFPTLNPYVVKDLLKAHAFMMEALIDNSGYFRRGGVGIFSGNKAVHIAPPADRVPLLMDDLFDWLQNSGDHLLIKSCVFHYEFEFIHPFMDGNGRLGRLWQSLILSRLHPVFEHLPVENMVFQNQQRYYEAIQQSTQATDSGIFVEFMLEEILGTLIKRQGKVLNDTANVGVNEGIKRIYDFIEKKPHCRIPSISKNTEIPVKTIERHVKKLLDLDMIEIVGSKKTGGYYIKKG